MNSAYQAASLTLPFDGKTHALRGITARHAACVAGLCNVFILRLQSIALHKREAAMRVAMRGVVLSALMLGLSGGVYAQGAPTTGGGGAGAGQGGNGEPTPNASGQMASPSDSPSNTRAPSKGTSHKQSKKSHKSGSTDSGGSAGAAQ